MKKLMEDTAPLCLSQIWVQTATKMNWRKSCPSELHSLSGSVRTFSGISEIKWYHILSFIASMILVLVWRWDDHINWLSVFLVHINW